ncbi:MAG: thiolase family protein [Alphaproteobacteria bacterium]|nr:thiolase family protein [Alphaproteobacteria bacterium]
MRGACVIAARRTAVAPRHGAFKAFEADELGAAVIAALLADCSIPGEAIDEVIFGNALYGGGNPARLAALRAGLPDHVPAMTIDTQCCAGLDAVILAADRIRSGAADAVIAGGIESFSRSPLRLRRPRHAGEEPQPYDRPPFAPWPQRDPDMIEAAARLANSWHITRAQQENFAIESHAKALQHPAGLEEIVELAGLSGDAFPRRLKPALCARLAPLAGEAEFAVTPATVAVEADAAAALLVVSPEMARRLNAAGRLRIVAAARRGGDPAMPGTAPIAAAKAVLRSAEIAPSEILVAEIMEAFASQAIACVEAIAVASAALNRGGGALARGHPIGASGAILMVRMWHELQHQPGGSFGLAAIAAAGGLGSALLARVEREG